MSTLKNNIFIYIICSICLLSLIVMYVNMFRFASPYAGTWDSVDFALALSRYDLLAMQPHFPGYPYFILGGMFTHQFIDNPAKALAVFNILLMLTVIVPVYLICRRNCSKIDAMLLVTVIMTASYVVVFVTQPMSEGAALAILCWYYWSLQKAAESNKVTYKVLPLLIFSILTGIRLSYLPFGIGILFLWLRDWRQSTCVNRHVRLLFYITLATFFQLIWVIGVAWTEGGIVTFLKLAFSFVIGHFTEWGGTATSDINIPFYERMYLLVFENLIWTGISATSIILVILYSSLIVLFIINRGFQKNNLHPWVRYMGIVYFIWVLFAQNIDKPRHILPIVIVALLVLFIPLTKVKYINFIYLIIAFITIAQTYTGTLLIKEQYEQPPATYQLANFLEQKSKTEPFVIYTWEEARIMDYFQATYSYKEIYTYDYFLQDKLLYRDKTTYVTDHVLKGFEAQGIKIKYKVKKVAEFKSNKLFDPVYGEIVLYEFINS
ncbi:MAG: nucleoporin-interacting protein [Bacillota bacterium]